MLPHKQSSLIARLWVEPVRPSPPRYEIWFGDFVSGREALEPALHRGSFLGLHFLRVASRPSQIQRSHGAQQMLTVDGSKTVREREVVHDSRPQFIGHLELLRRHTRQLSELEQGRGRKNQPPDFLQIPNSQLERIQQPVHINSCALMGSCQRLAESGDWNGSSRSLPAGCIPFHGYKNRAQGLDQERADVCPIRWWKDAWADVHLTDAEIVADGNRRKRCERMQLIGIAIAPRKRSEQGSRKSQVRPQRVLDPLSVETSDEGRDNASVQQSVKFAASVVGSRQVKLSFQYGLHELADPLRVWR